MLATFVLQPPAEFRGRSFFGVTEVLRRADGDAEAADERHDRPRLAVDRPGADAGSPQSYYVPERAGRRPVRASAATDARPVQVGVAGLGGGALATYVDDRTTMTFFEIDPVVIQVASDPRYFTYLADAPSRAADRRGRRSPLARGRAGRRASTCWSSTRSRRDSIPVHLLTVEAIADEVRTLAPDGLIVFHVSNRYYDLTPPIAAAVRRARASRSLVRNQHARRGPRTRRDAVHAGWPPPRDPSALAALRGDGLARRRRRPTTRSPTTTPTCCGYLALGS